MEINYKALFLIERLKIQLETYMKRHSGNGFYTGHSECLVKEAEEYIKFCLTKESKTK